MSEIFTTLFVDEIMIITGLIGALVSSNTKFAFWSFGMAAQIVRSLSLKNRVICDQTLSTGCCERWLTILCLRSTSGGSFSVSDESLLSDSVTIITDRTWSPLSFSPSSGLVRSLPSTTPRKFSFPIFPLENRFPGEKTLFTKTNPIYDFYSLPSRLVALRGIQRHLRRWSVHLLPIQTT